MALPSHGLILKEKWLQLVLLGLKTLEIRGKSTKKRGVIGLIKSGTGKVFGQVKIVDSFVIDRANFHLYRDRHYVADSSNVPYKTIHGWSLAEPITYDVPVAYDHCRGAQTWVVLQPELRGARKAKKAKKWVASKDGFFIASLWLQRNRSSL